MSYRSFAYTLSETDFYEKGRGAKDELQYMGSALCSPWDILIKPHIEHDMCIKLSNFCQKMLIIMQFGIYILSL